MTIVLRLINFVMIVAIVILVVAMFFFTKQENNVAAPVFIGLVILETFFSMAFDNRLYGDSDGNL